MSASIAIGSDHGGFEVKQQIAGILRERGIAVDDVGCTGREPVDYPDYAREVASRVSDGRCAQGILVCTTGIGMSIAANKVPGVRAALCGTPDMAAKARTHNDANVLVLGAVGSDPKSVGDIVAAWLDSAFSGEERHVRRVGKIEDPLSRDCGTEFDKADPETFAAIRAEITRQQNTLNMIASENHVSAAVRIAQGCSMTNKYAEGYPGKRWYSGCDYVDVVETLAISRACELFGADHANVQPHCGSSANMAVYFSVLQPGDTILAMSLSHGGHLTHGHDVNFSGRLFKVVSYGVNRETETIDYDEVFRLAREHRPKLIVAGASAYPRALEFEKFRAIADEVSALLMVDMAHIAGLVAGGAHASPVPYSEFVTTTTHKTLRGPRSGMVLCRGQYARDLDRQVFPGLQGGPLMHTIAAKAVCLREAAQPAFKAYAAQVVRNAQVLAGRLAESGLRIVSGGTDNHLMLVDLSALDLTGKDASAVLDKAGIIVNKNSIPFDAKSPFLTSGIRIGTPSLTTRGMKEPEMLLVGGWIADVLRAPADTALQEAVRARALELAAGFPVP
ncbi:MAG: ribose 5-phosphate isomerase B [Lentisphaerae bacterium]|nr:ribose 5-phosphate isomerase B [Lentisphaerota bacterium]